jgi:CHAT domain-containing protein
VLEIANLYPRNQSKTYLGLAATEAAVKQEDLMGYRRIHFATHAVMDERIPARSGVVLSLVDTGKEDGVLRMPEIFNLDLDADLVVLSACQTGLGKLVRGEGMVGLTRAFLYAGARRVAVSLWEVNDLATADFMKSFYQNMKGAAPAMALRDAKQAMIHGASPAYRHPYYWAPFVLTGPF